MNRSQNIQRRAISCPQRDSCRRNRVNVGISEYWITVHQWRGNAIGVACTVDGYFHVLTIRQPVQRCGLGETKKTEKYNCTEYELASELLYRVFCTKYVIIIYSSHLAPCYINTRQFVTTIIRRTIFIRIWPPSNLTRFRDSNAEDRSWLTTLCFWEDADDDNRVFVSPLRSIHTEIQKFVFIISVDCWPW